MYVLYVCMFAFVMDWCVTRAFFLFLYVTFFNHNINIFMVLLLIILLLSMIKINIQYIGNQTLWPKAFLSLPPPIFTYTFCHHPYILYVIMFFSGKISKTHVTRWRLYSVRSYRYKRLKYYVNNSSRYNQHAITVLRTVIQSKSMWQSSRPHVL